MAMTGGTAKLVKTGYGQNGNPNFPIKLYIYYKTSQSVADNKSTITCGMYVTTPTNWPIGIWHKSEDSYVGTKSITFNGEIPNFDGTYWIAENKSFTVDHKDDGTGKATIYWKWGVKSTWGGFDNPSGSFEITLPTIARASVPTAASSAKMGSTLTINTNRKSTSFTHTLKYTFGGTTATIATGVGGSYAWKVPDLAAKCNNALSGTCTITCITYSGSTKVGEKTINVTLNVPSESVPTLSATTVAMGNALTVYTNRASANFKHKISYSFNGATGDISTSATTSASWNVSINLAKQIKDKPSGTGTITCITYNGTKQVGTAKTVQFTATVPNNSTTQPTLSVFNLTPSGTVPSAFSGLYIQGKTGVKASYTATSTYSTVSSYQMTVDSKTYGGNPATSVAFASSGSKTVKGTVTDARGYYTQDSETILVMPYGKPTVVPYKGERTVICERCTSDGALSDSGMYLRIKAGRFYYKVMSDEIQKNFCSLGYRYKVSSATSYSSDVILIADDGKHNHPDGTVVVSTSDNNDEIDVAIPGIVESITTSYDVQIFVKDTMGETDTFTVRVPTAGTDFHLREGGDGAGFGKYAEQKGGVEFEWDVYGRAYGLGKLYEIPANSDLNDAKYRAFGCYAIKLDSTAATISNLPLSDAGVLRVFSSTGDGRNSDEDGHAYITQEYTPYTGDGVFRRRITKRSTGADWQFGVWSAIGGADAVVESGSVTKSDVTWHYRKWFDGTAECWGKRSVTVDVTTAWGSALYYGTVNAVNLPFEFAEPPLCSVYAEKVTTSSTFAVSNGAATANVAPSTFLVRGTSETGVNATIIYTVHGRWK